MNVDVKPLKSLLDEIPPDQLSETLDSVMIDYAIASVKEQQTQSPDEAVGNIRSLKLLRDALRKIIPRRTKPQ